MGISLGNAAAIVFIGGWWCLFVLRLRRLLQTGRTSNTDLPNWVGPLQGVGLFLLITAFVLFDPDTQSEVILMGLLPAAILTMFEAGTVWGRDNRPTEASGTPQSSSPTGVRD